MQATLVVGRALRLLLIKEKKGKNATHETEINKTSEIMSERFLRIINTAMYTQLYHEKYINT
jgi:hypothetical protein